MARMIYLRDVVTLELDEQKCTGCGICIEVCPHEVLARNGSRVRIVNRDACMECGACSRNCEPEAIQVQAGVGCAAAVINAAVSGGSVECGCSTEA